MPVDTNNLGDRGERWAMQYLTQYPKANDQALFRPQFLGAKWAAIDLYVEVVGRHKRRPFFFAQIKTTRNGYTAHDRKLRVQLGSDSIKSMLKMPAPTYFIGVDDQNLTAKVYIWSVRKKSQGTFPSLPTNFELTYANLKILRSEVVEFWRTNGKKPVVSAFEV